jgi:hypothetical protein
VKPSESISVLVSGASIASNHVQQMELFIRGGLEHPLKIHQDSIQRGGNFSRK